MMLVAFAVVATSSATSADPRRFFQADRADAAAYTLPDPLIDQAGRKITTAAEWEKTRRPEVLELFREHIYGRVPATRLPADLYHRERESAARWTARRR